MNGIEGAMVLVTGASRGIGEAIAAGFVQAGAQVHVLAEDEAVHATAERLGAIAHRADVTDAAAVQGVLSSFASLDVLVNNAGLERLTPIEDTDAATLAIFRRIVDINIVGTSIVTAHALPAMASGARIVNTASVWGRVAEPLFGAYVASKHAVVGLTKTWARELGPRGIRVNAVAPGWVRTVAALRSADALAERQGRVPADIIAGVSAGQALAGGLMEPADIVGSYLFLASDLSANVTGQTLGVDRGEAPF